ncbi:M23 family metallopeptidase [Streptomyces avermitilis]|uniref:M23 family metallopeptidase n=1 Tax=Streptomyces avermitilis TaxID=33903 RepID=UPI0033DC2859
MPGHKVTFELYSRGPYARKPDGVGRHTGEDFAAPTGAPVVAVSNGTDAWSNGQWTGLSAGTGHVYTYRHQSQRQLNDGHQIMQGQQLGRVGTTGRPAAPGGRICTSRCPQAPTGPTARWRNPSGEPREHRRGPTSGGVRWRTCASPRTMVTNPRPAADPPRCRAAHVRPGTAHVRGAARGSREVIGCGIPLLGTRACARKC